MSIYVLMERIGSAGFDVQSYTRSLKVAEKWLEDSLDNGLRCFTMVKPLNPPKVTTFLFEHSGDWYKMYDNETGALISSDHDIRVCDILEFYGIENEEITLRTEEQEDHVSGANTLEEALEYESD